MATQTTHYNLVKPSVGDSIKVSDLNGNSDTIDSTMYGLSQKMALSGQFITSFEPGWSANNVRLTNNGMIAILRVSSLRRSSSASGWVNAFRLPANMQNLSYDAQYGCFTNDSGLSGGVTNVAQVRVNSNGYVQIFDPAANTNLWGSIVFFL